MTKFRAVLKFMSFYVGMFCNNIAALYRIATLFSQAIGTLKIKNYNTVQLERPGICFMNLFIRYLHHSQFIKIGNPNWHNHYVMRRERLEICIMI